MRGAAGAAQSPDCTYYEASATADPSIPIIHKLVWIVPTTLTAEQRALPPAVTIAGRDANNAVVQEVLTVHV